MDLNWDWKNEKIWISAADSEGHSGVSSQENKGLEVGNHGLRGMGRVLHEQRGR